jgi:hypothetical protein
MWAAQKLARGAVDVKRNDILAIIRRDFDAAGVAQSDEDILAVMNVSWLEAGNQTETSDASDGALVQIARNLVK